MSKPITTLFMLMSVDGKISTGTSDELDVDKDFPKITGVAEGLHGTVKNLSQIGWPFGSL
ncbi:hypothetical protein [Faecalispora sporosphaeroides]|uniref:hypothetical protein n=1 Tax=Faecalispora sporosphaeroides TaxID=1549 RepID=UPI00036AB78E